MDSLGALAQGCAGFAILVLDAQVILGGLWAVLILMGRSCRPPLFAALTWLQSYCWSMPHVAATAHHYLILH